MTCFIRCRIAKSQQPSSNDEAVDDDAEVSQQLSRSIRSEVEGHDSGSALSNLRLRAPLSPRTTTDNIRFRTKFRRRHSSGSDDSINLSQNGMNSFLSIKKRILNHLGVIYGSDRPRLDSLLDNKHQRLFFMSLQKQRLTLAMSRVAYWP